MNNDEKDPRGFFAQLINSIIGIGLGESMLRVGTTLLSVLMLGTVVWLLRGFYAQTPKTGSGVAAAATEPASEDPCP